MKATDLKIGNLVSHIEESNVLVIDSINRESVWVNESPDYHYEMDIELISPIPLTEEWLIKLGFEKQNEFVVGAGICSFYKHPNFTYRLSESFKLLLLGIDIKHVHQLQNLYFALCGEELKF